MKTIIIIPCFNEEKNILNTVENLKKYKYEYIIVNDGSTDNTIEILEKNNLNFINLPNNVGIGAAVQTGYKYAKEHNYDVAIQFDGDGQHDAKYIETIINPIKNQKANMVIGSRFVGNESQFKSTKLRQFGITILSRLLKSMTGDTIKDMTSGFRAADKKIISVFSKSYPYEYPEPVTNLTVAQTVGMKIVEVPVSMNERKYGKSSITPLKSAYYMFNVILLFFIANLSKGDVKNAK